ncbi:MAG: hypothetical protein R6X18_02415 [Chloroflexota bacterium]|jgi:hypothetical protein
MDIINRRPGLTALVAFIAGLVIGLVVLGWGLFPVQFEGTDPSGLFPQYRDIYIRNSAELFSFDSNQDKVRTALSGWGGDEYACQMAQTSLDPADQQRLIAAATVVNGQGCTGLAAPGIGVTTGAPVAAPTDTESSSNLLPLLLLGLLLLLLVAAILYVYSRRQVGFESTGEEGYAAAPRGDKSASSSAPATAYGAPISASEPQLTEVPIARFRTQYTRGYDTYDDTFSIENANGEFLGECGVGIADIVGATTPRSVTAFEVWLFDKNDIRTITKVIMSDHAFFDEAIKAKLAPKGEPVLARENETIVLETASLIINAEITDMEYGDGSDMPDASYFDRFTIEVTAWVKDSENPGVAPVGGEEDSLNY